MALRAISLFAGAGGIDLALRGIARTVCYVENEAAAAAVLVKNMAEGSLDEAPVWSDIRTFDGRAWRGCVDLVTGGFPCQDISPAGKRAGLRGKHSGLWYEFRRVIGEIQPPMVFIENNAHRWRAWVPAVRRQLWAIGYASVPFRVRADQMGAPHQRARVFLAAHAHGDALRQQSGWRLRSGREVQALAADAGEVLADPDRPGLEEREGERRDTDAKRAAAERGDRVEADAHCGRCEAERRGWLFDVERQTFRPDLDGFCVRCCYRGTAWASESPVCRVDDGLADWSHRLGMLGNAVVPQQVRLAFRILWERMT